MSPGREQAAFGPASRLAAPLQGHQKLLGVQVRAERQAQQAAAAKTLCGRWIPPHVNPPDFRTQCAYAHKLWMNGGTNWPRAHEVRG